MEKNILKKDFNNKLATAKKRIVKSDFAPNLNAFYLMRLLWKSYSKNWTVLIINFVLPVLITTIFFNMLSKGTVQILAPGVILSAIVSSAFISFAVEFVEWKKSVLMKKVKISQISIVDLFVCFLLFYFFIGLLTFFFVLVYTIFLEQIGVEQLEGVTKLLGKMHWGYAMLGVFLLIISAIGLGFVIGFLVETTLLAFGICLTLFIVQGFLLSYYLPISLVVERKPMQIISWLMPFYSGSRIFQVSWLTEYQIGETNALMYLKDWQIINWVPQLQSYRWNLAINFHSSYWSLVLLALGWIGASVGVSFLLERYKKRR